jgi:phosphohistidine phosphatase
MMGRRLFDRNISFDLMLTSSATRALTTCQLIASQISYPLNDILVNKDIYNSSSENLKNIIFKTDNDINSLALFGHNPTLHIISEELSLEEISKFPTCSMAYFRFETDNWIDLTKCERKMLFFDYPENE